MTMTIQDVIDQILARIPGGPLEETVDTVKTGDPTQEVQGIVTTFLASYEVIQQAVDLGANFIITHEPTFYNHLDDTDMLEDDEIYRAKRQLLNDHNIVVWRFHDHWHRHKPDGIELGVIKALGWESYVTTEQGLLIIKVPAMTLGELVRHMKAKLEIDTVRVVGDPAMACENVMLMVGAPSGEWQMRFLARNEVDVLVTGEVREWETSEYARDTIALGRHKALVVLGHAKSEEPGMEYLVTWLQPMVPDVAITHVPVGDAFIYL